MFSQRLRELRFQRGFSLAELSKKTKISSSTLSKYENGEMTPKVEGLILLCKVLQCSADKLLGVTNEKELDPLVIECAEMIQSMGKFEREWMLLTIEGVKLKTSTMKNKTKLSAKFVKELTE